jgi:hypothetical protein
MIAQGPDISRESGQLFRSAPASAVPTDRPWSLSLLDRGRVHRISDLGADPQDLLELGASDRSEGVVGAERDSQISKNRPE